MVDLCKYKNALGEPGKGIHSYRFFGVAIMDVIMTLIGAAIISYFSGYSFLYVAIFLFILGIILHRLFCVRTTVDKVLFPNAT
jgi:fatty acid desaturase